MARKNLLSLHEAIVVALLNKPNREATFEEIASFITTRNLFPEREGNIPLATQVMLRSTKSSGAYKHLFEEVDNDKIRLRDR
jgi:hypothetical protein